MASLAQSGADFDYKAGAHLCAPGGARSGAVLVAEIDDWSAFADREGSDSAASLTDSVARLWLASLRENDLILAQAEGRLHLFLPGISGEDARHVAERLCSALRLHGLATADARTPQRLSASVGVAAMPENGSSLEALYSAASAACVRIAAQGGDGAGTAPPPHHELLHRPLSIGRFAGRASEFGTLVELLDQSVRGSPRVVSVAGAAGLGSATLLRQLEPEVRLRGGAFLLASSTESELPVPYAVWASLIRSLSRFPRAPKQRWHELQNLVPSLGDADGHSGARSGSQYQLLEEIEAYIRAAAEVRPLVIVLDEMQWADATSWDALEHLVGHLDGERLMICFAVRDERQFVDVRDRYRAFSRFPQYRTVELTALTREEVKQWLEAAFHRQPVGRDFLAYVYRQTEGNPFVIAQLLRLLLEEGALWFNGERWEWTAVSELRVPTGLRQLIVQRIGRFSASTQAVLNTSAVIGNEFDVTMVVAARAGSEAAIRPALAEAFAADFLRPSSDRQRGAYSFAHDRIISTILELLPPDRRKEIHGYVAGALAARADRPSAEVAYHFERAGDAAKAYRFATKAADEAERVYAYAAANVHLRVAARCATSPADLAEARLRLARLAEIGGRFDEVEELCDLAIEWFEGQKDEPRALGLRRQRQAARMAQGQSAKVTHDALTALDEEAQRLGLDRERVAILTLMAETLSRLGDRRTAQRTAGECVEMAEKLGDSPLLADAVSRLGRLLVHEAPERAELLLRQALELYGVLADVRGQARCYNTLAVLAEYHNRPEEAAAAYTLANSIARVAGVTDIAGAAASNLGVLQYRKGDYDRARELFAEAIAAFVGVKHSEYQLIALLNLAHCEMASSNWGPAAELFDTTMRLAQRIGQSDVEIGAIAGKGLCLLSSDREDAARKCHADAAVRTAERPDWFQGREVWEALAVKIAVRDGRWAEAWERFETALAMAEASELWAAAWLMAECAETLAADDAPRITQAISRISARVESLGYSAVTRRYAVFSGV